MVQFPPRTKISERGAAPIAWIWQPETGRGWIFLRSEEGVVVPCLFSIFDEESMDVLPMTLAWEDEGEEEEDLFEEDEEEDDLFEEDEEEEDLYDEDEDEFDDFDDDDLDEEDDFDDVDLDIDEEEEEY